MSTYEPSDEVVELAMAAYFEETSANYANVSDRIKDRARPRFRAALATAGDAIRAEVLGPVAALLARYEAWDGDRDSPWASSPRQREQLRETLGDPDAVARHEGAIRADERERVYHRIDGARAARREDHDYARYEDGMDLAARIAREVTDRG